MKMAINCAENVRYSVDGGGNYSASALVLKHVLFT